MKHLFIFLCIILVSCNENNSDLKNTRINGVSSYIFQKNKLIETTTLENSYLKFGNIITGNKTVFEYRFDADDNEQIADDEYSETIRFQIDPNLDSFHYENSEMENSKITFSKYCYCYFPLEASKNVSPKGRIEGVKISDSKWNIKIDVVFYGNEKRTIE